MRMLVVEDEPKMAGLVKRGLEREGYAVDVVANGTDALWAATETDYDAIVLDAMIPPPDGFEVCRRLKASTITHHLPVSRRASSFCFPRCRWACAITSASAASNP